MNKEKLTEREIAKVFCLYGIEAPVRTLDGDGDILVVYPRVVEVHLSVIGYQQEMKGRKGGGEMHYKYSFEKQEVQLLLTPLSKITDEHAIEVMFIDYSNISNGYETIKIDRNEKSRIHVSFRWKNLDNKRNLDDGYSYSSWATNFSTISKEEFQYLISKGYAVPLWFGIDHWANNKTAIELSLAIEQNNLKLNV